MKASLSDTKKTIAEVAKNIESRTTFDDLRRVSEEKASKTEVGYWLQSKASIEELR